MLTDSFSLAPADLYVLTSAIRDARLNDGNQALRRDLAGQFNATNGVWNYRKTDTHLSYCLVYSPQICLVLIDGVRNQTMAQLVIDGYSGGFFESTPDPRNLYFEDEAHLIADDMTRLGLWGSELTLFAGYSAGGAVAMHMPFYRPFPRTGPQLMRAVSFGAPRASGPSRTTEMGVIAQRERYFFFDDPIAAFPLRSGTYTWLPFLIGSRPARRWANFVHPTSGIQINADLGYTYVNDPTGVVIDAPTAFDVWLNGLNSEALSPHNLTRYISAFPAAVETGRSHTGQIPGPQERPESLPPREISAQERRTVNLVRELQQTQDETPLVIPRERLAIAYRQGRVWYVAFGGTVIMSTPSRRRARGAANELNAFLRRMQSTAIVDPAAVTAQMEAYLAAASDPTSGIRPTLNTTIPS